MDPETAALLGIKADKVTPIDRRQRGTRLTGGWQDGFTRTLQDKPHSNLNNALLALRKAPELAGKIRLNEFSGKQIAAPDLLNGGIKAGEEITSEDVGVIAAHMQNTYGLVSLSPGTVHDAVAIVARENSFHPVREYLQSLKWDGTPRLAHWLEDYLGAEEREVIRAMGRKWLISAVARVMEPGCQADYALVLEGHEGLKKSSALEILAGKEHFTVMDKELGSKDSRSALQGNWIAELAELESVRRSENSAVKAFLTQRVDKYRPAYGRRDISVPRQCIFGGTTNEDHYLQSGANRRFWPVRCSAVKNGLADLDGLRDVRDQLWAEAYAAYKAGEQWYLTPEMEAEARGETIERRMEHPWQDLIESWLENPTRITQAEEFATTRNQTCVRDILIHCIKKTPEQMKDGGHIKVAECLKNLGWVPSRGKERPKLYFREAA
jgi:predicted P-loop ATPase